MKKRERIRQLEEILSAREDGLNARDDKLRLLTAFIFRLDPDHIPQDVRDVLAQYYEEPRQ